MRSSNRRSGICGDLSSNFATTRTDVVAPPFLSIAFPVSHLPLTISSKGVTCTSRRARFSDSSPSGAAYVRIPPPIGYQTLSPSLQTYVFALALAVIPTPLKAVNTTNSFESCLAPESFVARGTSTPMEPSSISLLASTRVGWYGPSSRFFTIVIVSVFIPTLHITFN